MQYKIIGRCIYMYNDVYEYGYAIGAAYEEYINNQEG